MEASSDDAFPQTDQAVEQWLREEAAAAYDAHKADPAAALPADEVFRDVREGYRARKAAKAAE